MSITTFSRILILTLIAYAGHAQNFSQPYIDQEAKPDSYVRATAYEPGFVYLAGSTTNACGVVPLLSKVSVEDGSVIWTTSNNASIAFEYARRVSLVTIAGDVVYAYIPAAVSAESDEVWKVDKSTGTILWRGQAPQEISTFKSGIYSYSTHVVVCLDYTILLFNAETGVLEKTYSDGWGTFMGVTHDGEIVIRDRNDGAIKLVQNFDFTAPETIVAFPYDTRVCNSGIKFKAYAVDSDKLLVFASQGCSRGVTLIDYKQKTVLWQTDAFASADVEVTDYTIHDGYLYASFKSLYVGSGVNPFAAAKINMATGALIWRSLQSFTTYYPGSEGSNVKEGDALSVCVDGTGDVYLTGSANTEDGFGDMGIIKLSGATGQKLYDKVITESNLDFDFYSFGLKAISYNGAPYFIGNVTTGSNYVFNSNTLSENPGNNIVMVQLQPSDGTVLKRYDYKGKRVENSRVKKIAAYKDGHTLMLQNKGRHTYLSRHTRSMDMVWETELKATQLQYYGQQPIDVAVDAEGNIGVLTMPLALSKDSRVSTTNTKPMAFIVNENGIIVQEFTKLGGSTAFDAYADDNQFFFSTSDGNSTSYLTKADATGARMEVYYYRSQLPTKAAGRRMGSTSNNKLVLLGESFYATLIDKTTLEVTKLGRLLSDSDWATPEDMLVANDTLYAVAYNSSGSYTNLLCYSLIDKKIIWSNTGSTGNYYRLERDDKGDIYALGTGQYSGMFLRKVNGRTGVSQWYNLWTYANDIEANDLFIDKIRKQVVVTGYRNISQKPYYATVIFDAAYGATRLLSISTSMGQGLTIGQAGNGNIISGGELINVNSCGSYSTGVSTFYTSTAMEPIAVEASQDQEDHITITWESGGSGTHYRLYRSTVNNPGLAEQISGFITETSFNDLQVEVAKPYYYYVSASLDQNGKGSSALDESSLGFRILLSPVVDSVIATEDKTLLVSWEPSVNAQYYRVHRAASAAEAQPITEWISAMAYADTNREPGVSYYYFVQAAQNDQGSFASRLSAGREGKVAIVTGTETASNETTSIYPNPFSEELTVHYSSDYLGDITISLSTAQGTETSKIHATKRSLTFDAAYTLDSLHAGVYILVIEEGGGRKIRQKIIKR